MLKKIIILFHLFILLFVIYSDNYTYTITINEPKYKIEICDNLKSNFDKNYDDFKFIYYMYKKLIIRYGLSSFSLEDKVKIIDELNKNIKNKIYVILYINNFLENKDLQIKFFEAKGINDIPNNILMVSNYDIKINRIISENDPLDNVASNLFFINNQIFKDFNDYNVSNEFKYLTKKDYINLSRLYIFNDIIKKQEKIENLMINKIKENDIYSYIVLIEYYLYKRNFLKANDYYNLVNGKGQTKDEKKEIETIYNILLISEKLLK